MKIALAGDHAGFEMKDKLIDYLKGKGHEVTDLGTFTPESADYTIFGHALAENVSSGKSDIGFSLCGSGNGINMTANKHPKIRAALCWNVEISRLARAHNNANICSLPARFINLDQAKIIVDTFLNTPFDGGRHQNRIDKIPL